MPKCKHKWEVLREISFVDWGVLIFEKKERENNG